MKPALCVAVSLLFGVQLAHAVCSHDAIFLTFDDQIRGYSARANGATEPCQVLQGPLTTLMTAGATTIDEKDAFHVAQFDNDAVDIFPRKAEGNQAPDRSFTLPMTNDLASIAVDSHLNDFVMSVRPSTAGVMVIPARSSGPIPNPVRINDPYITHYQSIAIDGDDNLLIAGYDIQGTAIIDTFGTSRSVTAPPLLRSLTGPKTGLFPGLDVFFSQIATSIAIDPRTDELFVYNTTAHATQTQVSVFAPKANGNVRPLRTISGPDTGLTAQQLARPGNRIAVSPDGRLFFSDPSHLRVLAFAPGARGNVAPSQVIEDSAPGPTYTGGIAFRSGRVGHRDEDGCATKGDEDGRD
ncbi:hypothetical protein SAMN05446934_9718 [Paraburkholderia hospita]|jgi:hypothetical protein|nr:hypothetical protein PMI06_008990 [Burkholderia sp. BT03]SKC55560.1 hypothetical protein SAMN06266956_0750 [Paraburkholderia hospita]SKD05746.1 hypothetical protein SAMN05446934_9718 [Paraburkholderia hospita]